MSTFLFGGFLVGVGLGSLVEMKNREYIEFNRENTGFIRDESGLFSRFGTKNIVKIGYDERLLSFGVDTDGDLRQDIRYSFPTRKGGYPKLGRPFIVSIDENGDNKFQKFEVHILTSNYFDSRRQDEERTPKKPADYIPREEVGI